MTNTKKVLFVAFSHFLTAEQIFDAEQSLGITDIATLNDLNPDLQRVVSNIDPESTTDEIKDLASKLVDEAFRANATHFFVAGEPTLVLHASIFAVEKGLVVVQSTTKRDSVETTKADGTVVKTAVFKHVQWRKVF